MEKFNVNTKTTVGLCDAKRCPAIATTILNNGVKLCGRHAGLLTQDEKNQFFAEIPKHLETDTTEQKAIKKIEPIELEANEYLQIWEGLIIDDSETADLAGEMRKEVHDKIEDLEKERKKITSPLLLAKKNTDALFKPAVTLLKQVKQIITEKLTGYMEEQERKQQEALLLAAKKLEACEDMSELSEDYDEFEEFENSIDTAVPAGTQVKNVWEFEVLNIKDVPEQYLLLNEPAIRAYMKEQGPENAVLPGIRFYSKQRYEVSR